VRCCTQWPRSCGVFRPGRKVTALLEPVVGDAQARTNSAELGDANRGVCGSHDQSGCVPVSSWSARPERREVPAEVQFEVARSAVTDTADLGTARLRTGLGQG
jgi:hypothetical protein